MERIDASAGVIYGVSVITKGDAKGHNMIVDDTTLKQVLSVAQSHKDGVKTKFGADHKAGISDVNGVLRNFRIEGDKVKADLHLLKADIHFAKLLELAQTAPNEFGLSASFSGDHEIIGHDKCARCSEIYSVDLVSDPAANPNGLFSTKTNNNTMKEIALALGLPESATEAEIIAAGKIALEAKCKYEADAEAKKKLEAEAEKKKMEGKKEEKDEKFSAVVEQLTNLSAKFEALEKSKVEFAAAAHKTAIDALVSEASKDGKIVPLSGEALYGMNLDTVKEMFSKLPKNQISLSNKKVALEAVNADSKLSDFKSAEFRNFCAARKAEGAVELTAFLQKSI